MNNIFKTKKTIIEIYILLFLLITLIPIVIFDVYCIDWVSGKIIKEIEMSDVIVYISSAMTLLGTLSLGILTLYNNYVDRERTKNSLRPIFNISEDYYKNKLKIIVRSQDSKSFYYNLYISAYLQWDNQTIPICNMISEEKIKEISICVLKERMTSDHFFFGNHI